VPTDEESETEDERFDRLYTARRQAERDEETRNKKLKDMGLTGDVLNAIADAVWTRGEELAAARRRAEEDADQAPSTTKKERPNFLKQIGLASGDD
jgi:hypothetical protein